MLVSIGRKRPPTDAIDTILGCHARIRSHIGTAVRIADSRSAGETEICEAAERVWRYFGEALPLHTLDEDKSLLPGLIGRSDHLDRVLATMQHQHREHEPHAAVLLSLVDTLRTEPSRLDDLRSDLSRVASWLSAAFDEHLTLEERVVFPAARELLTPSERAALTEDLRRRHRGADPRACVAAG